MPSPTNTGTHSSRSREPCPSVFRAGSRVSRPPDRVASRTVGAGNGWRAERARSIRDGHTDCLELVLEDRPRPTLRASGVDPANAVASSRDSAWTVRVVAACRPRWRGTSDRRATRTTPVPSRGSRRRSNDPAAKPDGRPSRSLSGGSGACGDVPEPEVKRFNFEMGLAHLAVGPWEVLLPRVKSRKEAANFLPRRFPFALRVRPILPVISFGQTPWGKNNHVCWGPL